MSASLGQLFKQEHAIEDIPDLIPQRAMAAYKRAQLYTAGFLMVYVLVGVVVVMQTRLVERINNQNWLNVSVNGWHPLSVLVDTSLLFCTIGIVWFPGLLFARSRLPAELKMPLVKYSRRFFKRWGNRYLFILLFVEIVSLFMAFQPLFWWLWVTLSYLLMSKVRQIGVPSRLRRRYNITPLPDKMLEDRLMAVVDRAKLPRQRIKLLAMSPKHSDQHLAAQAFVADNRVNYWIVFSHTLLERFSIDELEIIVAHELGHVVHHDGWKRQLVSSCLILCAGLGWFIFSSPFVAPYLVSSFISLFTEVGLPGVQFLWIYLVVFLLGIYLGAYRIAQWYRRQGEQYADIFALQLTRNVPAFRSAMTRLAKLNRTPMRSSSAFYSHPSLIERLHYADQFEAQQRTIMQ